ncbi:MAG TPA: serine/threonine-protein kinase [Rudaea sp.]
MNPEHWQRIAAVFDEIIELPPGERRAAAVERCAGDARLLAEVERLLAADDKGGHFESEALHARDAAIESWSEPQPDLAMPSRIGHWRLLGELGRGGMGVVYLAQRVDGQFEQRAALKLVKRGLDTEAVLSRFLRERQILARLENPHIARLLDGGVADDGRPYFAMEFVSGAPLLEHCKQQRLPLEARIRLFVDICSAVQFAHNRLVVHSDIKPGNILITDDGQAKLLDFGIAKMLDGESGAAQTIGAAQRPLTPGYAAPEQLRGDPVTTAVDIYALGNVLYELLTGRGSLPVPATTNREDVLRFRETTDPKPPSAVAEPGLPFRATRLRGDLDTIVLTALQREAARRYETVQALAEDLERYLAGRPIQARRQSAAYRFARFVGRHKTGVALGTTAIVALMTTTGLSIYGMSMARQQMEQARAQALRAETTSRFLADVFGQVSPDQNKGQPITANQLLQAGERNVDSEAPHASPARSELLALLGRLYRDIGDRTHGQELIARALTETAAESTPAVVRARILLVAAMSESEDKETYERALAHASESVTLLEREPTADPAALAEAHVQVGYALRHTGANERAAASLSAAIAGDSAILGADNENVAEENVQLGIALAATKRFDESERAFEHAIGAYTRRYGAKSVHVAHALDAFAGMRYDKGDLAQAERLYRQALDIHRQTLGPLSHDTLVGVNNLLRVLETRGEFAAALAEREELKERSDTSKELTPTDRVNSDLAMSVDYIETSRFAEGERLIREAIGILRDAGEMDSAWYAYSLEFLGYALPWQGKFEEAEKALRSALKLTQSSAQPDASSTCRLQDSLSWVLDLQRRYADALRLARKVDAECTAALPPTSKQLPTYLSDLSAVELDSGNVAQARAIAARALGAARTVYPPQYYRLGIPLLALARADLALEQAAEAETLLREALAVRQPPYSDDDPRVLEVRVELVRAEAMNGRPNDAITLRSRLLPVLEKDQNGYLRALRARLWTP